MAAGVVPSFGRTPAQVAHSSWLTTITSGTVSISGTPTVQFAAGQQVNIGTVTGTINIQGVSGGFNVGVDQPQALIPGSPFTVAQDGLGHSLGTFTLPTGCHTVGFTFANPAGIAQLQVIGTQSGIDYAARSLAGVTVTVTVKVYSGIDASVQVIVTTNNLGGNTTVRGVFILGAQVVTLDSEEFNGVFLETNLGQVISSDVAGTGQRSLAVSERYANPAPW